MKFIVGALASLLHLGIADAAEIKVFSAGGMREVLNALIPDFQKVSGHTVTMVVDTAGAIKSRILKGDKGDIAILPQPLIKELTGTGMIVPETTVVLARAAAGVAVRQGSPKPDISSVDAFKESVLKAKSVAHADPALGSQSGIHIAQVLASLGLVEKLKGKIVLTPGGGRVGGAVARGEAEFGLSHVNELIIVPGIDLVGRLPDELQTEDLAFSGGALKNSQVVANDFLRFLRSPVAQKVITAKGMDTR